MEKHADIELRVLSQPRYLAVVRAAVEAAAQRLGFSAEVAGKIVLAVDEAVTNVIRHGYGGREDQPIWLFITPVDVKGEPAMQIVIEDECHGIDLGKIQGRPLEQVRPGGLGVHIIHGVMDEVQYSHRTCGQGISLRMLKIIRPDAPAQKG